MSYDYEELGLVAGLEIHQQLDTETKLFCNCPTERREPEESVRSFVRYLHPTKSELGELDEAALEESRVDREFEYLAYDTTCLVEEDDEPPHRLDQEALDTTMEIASLLDCEVTDQAHVMRKIVVDGSNTSGFQRSSLVATDGQIETDEGSVGIADLLLEEESAARIEEHDAGVTYGLDRLGIPLVEIGTKPDIRSPEQARDAAERIGMLLRSTGKVKRGLGTIRQDVNVSIKEGARVEMKGVQSLDDIDDIVRNEVGRQVELLDIADELQSRDAAVGDPQDVSAVFEESEAQSAPNRASGDEPRAESDSGVIAGAETVTAVRLEGFDGLVGREIQPDRRLGTEFSDHAKRHGAGGIFHTDELPAYGVTEAEVVALREAVGAREARSASDGASGDEPRAGDAVALVAADTQIAEQAIEAVADRAAVAIEDVPEETRGANEDGTSRYLRPLPGAARMYPETDVPPVEPDLTDVEPPELLSERVDRYQEEFGLDAGLAEQVAYGRHMPTFEEAVDRGIDPTTAAGTLESTRTELRRDGVPVEKLTEEHLLSVLELVESGDLATEGIGTVLTELAEDSSLSAEAAIEAAGLSGVSREEVREVVEAVVERNAAQIEAQGMGAFSGLMGECMGALRGKAEGEVVSELLREEIGERT
jgi:glutamyl-tRNA(Gln) amidotransferase subunit E